MWDLCLKIFINDIIPQVALRQNFNALKLCSVASEESFVTFLYINELYRKKACFEQTGRSISFLQICTRNVLAFKENHAKIKKTGRIHMFF